MLKRRALALSIAAGSVLLAPAALAQSEFGSPELIAAAKKEGRVVFYTANFAEPEQELINAFNKRFPEVKVEMVRAPGGQLITRIKTEAAAGKLAADFIEHSDRGLMKELENLFTDYTPPNAADYPDDSRVSPKLWPSTTLGWAIAYNPMLVKNPPKTWMDLTKPEYTGMIGQVVAPSGGTTWTRAMFERQVLGEGYHAEQAKLKVALYPSGAPLSDALVRGEVAIAPLLYNIIFIKIRDGAPGEAVFAPEGVPIIPYAGGITASSTRQNAARLFLNWRLSKEAQTFMIKEQGNITSMKNPPMYPKGWDPKVVKTWLPKFDEFEKLRSAWLEDWNKTYNYRQ
jgi:iron(III) transport system substrate-binding protein